MNDSQNSSANLAVALIYISLAALELWIWYKKVSDSSARTIVFPMTATVTTEPESPQAS